MRLFSILIFCILTVSRILADEPITPASSNATLAGTVKSGAETIPYATVAIKGTTIGAAADAFGNFELQNIPAGARTVIVSAVGYKPYTQLLNLEKSSRVTFQAELVPDNIGIEQVIVSADRNARSRQGASTIVNSIGAKLFQRTQSITLSEGLNFSPGLRMENNCQNCGFSQLRMNGLEGPYTQILINSRPVFSGLAGVYGLELIPANMIERVEIIRGGGSSMYGSNAIAGTVNLITKDPISNVFSIETGTGLTGAQFDDAATDYNLNLNGSFVTDDYKTGLSLIGFYRNRQPFDANNDGFSELASINNHTLGARFYQRVANRGKFTVDYFNINEFRRGGNKFELPLHEADIAESVDHEIHSGAANYEILFRESDKLSLFFSGQYVNRDSYYGANQDPSAYGNTHDFTYSSGLQYIRRFNSLIFSPASVSSGIEFNGSLLKDMKLGYYDPADDIHYGNTQVAHQKLASRGGFLQSEWDIKKWVVTAGVRFDNYEVVDLLEEADDVTGNVLSPRLSLLYNIAHHWQLRMGYAKGFRAPQIFDEDLHIETSGSRKVLHQNDPDLKQETSGSFTTSLNYTYSEGKWQFQGLVEGFYTQLMNPFTNVYGIPDEDGVVVYTRRNAEQGAKVQGMNIEFNASPSNRIQFQSGFTFQKSLYDEPQEFGERRFFRSPDKYGYLSINYAPSLKLNLSATGNYSGPMLVPYFGPALTNPDEGELRTTHAFFDAGLKAAYMFRITEHLKLEVNAGIKNIFNAYQQDFDTGVDRDPAYMYGPLTPRTVYIGLRIGSLL